MNPILKLYEQLSKLRIKLPRIIDAYKELRLKRGHIPFGKLTKEQKLATKAFWGKLKPTQEYLSLYNYNNQDFDPKYIPDDMYYADIDTYFNNGIDCMSLDDKNMYDLYFPDIKQPKTIARKHGNIYTDELYNIINLEDVLARCIKQSSVIIKKSTLSNGGKNIIFWHTEDGINDLKSAIQGSSNLIIQEIIKQHNDIGKIHPNSLNSIRILSLTRNNSVHILSSIIRMGANGANVDNGHSGGIFVGLDENGRFKDTAYTYMSGQKFQHKHPTTNIPFTDCRVPNYDRCLELVKKLAPRLCRFSRLTSWDLSVDESGEPVLIEVNLAYGGLFFHQISNGPVFGELTKEILEEVYNVKI